MKENFFLVLTALILTAGSAPATEFLNPKGSSSIIDTSYNDDLFITGSNIRFDGIVWGDMYVACNEIVYTDTVTGSLHAFCKSVEGLGAVGRSFVGFAYQIAVNAPVGRNLLGFARIIEIGPETVVGNDANLYGATVTFQGTVGKDLTIRSDDAFISGNIDGDLHFEGGVLSISPDAVIHGDLIYCSPEKADIEDRAIIEGETKWTQCEREEEKPFSPLKAFSWIASQRGYFLSLTLFSLLIFILTVIPFPGLLALAVIWISLLISGNLFIMATKDLSRKTEIALTQRTLPSVGLGFAIVILAPLAILILLLSIFGIPLSAVLILGFGLAAFAGGIYSSLFVGRRLCALLNIGSAASTGYGCFSLGMVVLVALSFIPILGYIVFLIAIMMGMGGLALALYGRIGTSLPPAPAVESR